MPFSIRQRSACRLCGDRDVRPFLHFERLPFADGFVKPGDEGSEFLADLDIFFCAACHTAQTQQDVEVSDYYRDYHYTVSASPLVQSFMRRLAQESIRRYGLGPGDRVLDIGSSDGFQLKCFQDLGLKVLGFEPSEPLVRASRSAGVPVLQRLFTAETIREIPADLKPAQAVVTLHTLDHLPDPADFLKAIRSVLDPERGILVIEVHDLEKVVERREACLFAHDHAIYLSVLSMQRLLDRCGLVLLTEDLLPEAERRGNSLTIVAAPKGSRHAAGPLRRRPSLDALEAWETFPAFGQSVLRSFRALQTQVRERRQQGRRLAGYSAGGRTVMTMAMADLDREDLPYLVDRNRNLHGLLTGRSHVPVFPPEHIYDDPVDELLVFSFGYLEEIRQQLAPFVRRGGCLTSLLDLL